MSTSLTANNKEHLLQAFLSGNEDQFKLQVSEFHYADLADFFEDLEEDQREYFTRVIGPDTFSDILPNLPGDMIEQTLELFSPGNQLKLLSSITDDDLADVLQDVSSEAKERYFSSLNPEDKKIINALLQYGEDTAGGRMTTHYGRVNIDMNIAQALEELRSIEEEAQSLGRIYVVDDQGALVGKIKLRHLAFCERETPIKSVMAPVMHRVLASADQEDAIQMFTKYDMFALPVVNEHDHLLGVITHDDAMDIFEQEFTEDIEKMAGVSGEHSESSYLNTGVLVHFKRRFPWLVILALLAISSGFVMLKFDDLLKDVYILALYLPMIVAAGGNTGGQAATMVTRAMALGELDEGSSLRVAWKEVRLGLFLGSLLGIIMGTVTYIIIPLLPSSLSSLPDGITVTMFAVTAALSLAAQITTSTLTGAVLPLLARRMKIDPAVIASPAITTIVDVSGLVIYFSVASFILP